MALYSGSQWEVTKTVVRALPPERYDFTVKRLAETHERHWQEVYSWPSHLAEKGWVDIEDFIDVFENAWKLHADKLPPLDMDMLERSKRQARKIAARGY